MFRGKELAEASPSTVACDYDPRSQIIILASCSPRSTCTDCFKCMYNFVRKVFLQEHFCDFSLFCIKLRHDHGRSIDRVLLHCQEGIVGLIQFEDCHFRFQTNLCG